jgi:late competence protein required for DNA uptake (superfamily II DNA/RNA helicase)
MATFKQKCPRCKNNWVIVSYRNSRYTVCYDCEKSELEGEINDPEMKSLFDIPIDFYKNNAFLRDIKKNYLKWGKLSEKQIEAFKKSVEKMSSEKDELNTTS